MKKSIFLLFLVLVCLVTTGCYDMVDIEDIGSVAAIFVDSDSITYCTVTASPDEKKYSYELYTSDVGNLYTGMNTLSERTGKEISLSHMEAVMFSADCPIDRVKENINALLGRTNSHPKSLVACYEGGGEDFAKDILEGADISTGKHLRHLLDNRFSGVALCTAMEFCYGVNFEGGGSVAPLIASEDGDITYTGLVYASPQGMVSIPRPCSDIINAVKNQGKKVNYGEKSPVEIECTSYDVVYDKVANRADISAEFELRGFGSSMQTEAVGKDIREGMEYIVALKDSGFDILDIYTDIRKTFYTIPAFENYVTARGGAVSCVRNVDVNIRTGVGGEKE